jgi:phytoene synthase
MNNPAMNASAASALRASYQACRRLNSTHGKTYYLATLLLPVEKRPSVHALYGFARYTDELVDDLTCPLDPVPRADRLSRWEKTVLSTLDSSAPPLDPIGSTSVLPALWDTVRRWNIPVRYFGEFFSSMRMDLTVGSYPTWDDLLGYVHGSAAVIGLQMLPVLEHPGISHQVAAPYARDLGIAFQLVNFIRDVGEDLRRDRIYLPLEDLALFGVDQDRLRHGVTDGRIRRLLAFEIARCREILRSAEPGIRLLHPTSQDCVRTALRLYGGILDEVERCGYRVLDRRATVSSLRRTRIALPGLIRAYSARRDFVPDSVPSPDFPDSPDSPE